MMSLGLKLCRGLDNENGVLRKIRWNKDNKEPPKYSIGTYLGPYKNYNNTILGRLHEVSSVHR